MPRPTTVDLELVIALEADQPFAENALEVLSKVYRDIQKDAVRLLQDAPLRVDGEARLKFEHRSHHEE